MAKLVTLPAQKLVEIAQKAFDNIPCKSLLFKDNEEQESKSESNKEQMRTIQMEIDQDAQQTNIGNVDGIIAESSEQYQSDVEEKADEGSVLKTMMMVGNKR